MRTLGSKYYYRRFRSPLALFICLWGILCLAVVVYFGAQRVFIVEDDELVQTRLKYYATSLETTLDKHRVITPILARRPDFVAFIKHAHNRTVLNLNGELNQLAGMIGVGRLDFVTNDGLSYRIQSGQWEKQSDLRPDIRTALQGTLGRWFFADQEKRRWYAFAAPVRDGDKIIGAIGLTVNLEEIEEAWALTHLAISAVDENGRVFLSNQASWRLKYEPENTINSKNIIQKQTLTRSFLKVQKMKKGLFRQHQIDLPIFGWKMILYSNIRAAQIRAGYVTLIVVLAALLVLTGIWIYFDRRRRLVDRMRLERASGLRLERRVKSRTRDLEQATDQLKQEISERIQAEESLKLAQSELIHAAKLAAIGQMSAALSHEFNQPLTAIRAYADTGMQFLELKKLDDVGDNLSRIQRLTDRMARLGRTLKTFARRPGAETTPISVFVALDEVLMLLGPRIKQSPVTVSIVKPDDDIQVLAGQVRFEQILVNLMSNALDILKGRSDPRLEIRVQCKADHVEIAISDNGPGIDPAIADRIFEPFFTASPTKDGLGLGLSIVYSLVKGFNGEIKADNLVSGGAVFTLCLPVILSEKPS